MWRRTVRQSFGYGVAAAFALSSMPALASAQSEPKPLLQLEVGDSIGLPLPDAKLEVYTLLDGGIVWEWADVEPWELPPGINLLRFSHPGYRTSLFSVPLAKGSTTSLRVRLGAEPDTARRSDQIEAHEVRAIGLVLDGRSKTDIIGRRRVLERHAVEAAGAATMGALMRRARNTELNVFPDRGGTLRVLGRATGGSGSCSAAVMIQGDRRRVLGFATFEQMFTPGEVEAIEVFPRGDLVPFSYRGAETRCGLLVVWFRNP
jgi:hypothetical protein